MSRVLFFGIAALLASAGTALASHGEGGEQQWFVNYTYIVAAIAFILALKWLSHPKTARRGVMVGELGMLLAIVGTLVSFEIVNYTWIFIAFGIGAAIGVPLAVFMPMTAVPQRTALSHAFGALAAALVGTAHFLITPEITTFDMIALIFEMLLGFLTFTGSLMAFGKLQEILPSQPMVHKGQNFINFTILGLAVVAGIYLIIDPSAMWMFPIFITLSLLFGVLLILPIGGADMPTVIALLNSYAGLSASLMGFVLNNKLLIVAGALDGASGLILSIIMCKAMNRSFTNVLFGAFGATTDSGKADDIYGGKVKSVSAEDVAMMFEGAQRVVFIPGYGMAVAQAQFAVRDLANLLQAKGTTVEYAIHPVAGRMPGHMNVLLAEASVPYDEMVEMDDINPTMPQVDVAVVIGANDTVNPIARTDPNSPIAGMPIIDADKARNVIVIKRSLSPGFAGIANPLFVAPNSVLFFADGKKAIMEIIAAVKAA